MKFTGPLAFVVSMSQIFVEGNEEDVSEVVVAPSPSLRLNVVFVAVTRLPSPTRFDCGSDRLPNPNRLESGSTSPLFIDPTVQTSSSPPGGGFSSAAYPPPTTTVSLPST
ncbi:hypothetical protein CRG98_014462 [Punica granatum]|uniref:Uncharacterized protein n=1 Tax=Punica granatum TaxID=22663 RepID=A0A2I0K9B6_PUNGR|nr:hypothetical protein CRG98_014462 [Punica granatum]